MLGLSISWFVPCFSTQLSRIRYLKVLPMTCERRQYGLSCISAAMRGLAMSSTKSALSDMAMSSKRCPMQEIHGTHNHPTRPHWYLHLPPSRRHGADPSKLARQISKHGSSLDGMPPLELVRGKDGHLRINDG